MEQTIEQTNGERKPYGYLVKYESTEQLPETLAGLIGIADKVELTLRIHYRQTSLNFFKAIYGNGLHSQELEEMLTQVPNVMRIERDYLEKRIEDSQL